MTVEAQGNGVRVSRRKVLLSSVAGVLALASCAVVAGRAGWIGRISTFLAGRRRRRTLELKFSGPFEGEKPLLEGPIENDWVRVDKAIVYPRDPSPKNPSGFLPSTEDALAFDFTFHSEILGKGTRKQRLADPYRIAFSVVVEDRWGKTHRVFENVVDYDPEVVLRDRAGFMSTIGENVYGGLFRLPIKLRDTSGILIQLSKVDS